MINKLLQRSPERITLVDRALASGGNFLLTIIMVRSFGFEGFGIFAALSIIYLFMLGLQQELVHAPIMVFYSKAVSPSRLITDYFIIEVLFIVLCILLWMGVDVVITTKMPVPFRIEYVVLIITMLLLEFLRRIYILLHKPYMILLLNGAIWLEVAMLMVMPYYSGAPHFTTFILIMSTVNALSILMGLVQFPFLLQTPLSWFRSCKESLNYSVWLVGGSLLQWYNGNYLLILVQAKFDIVALGTVRAAQAFLGPLTISLAALENAFTIQGAHIHSAAGWNAFNQYWTRRFKLSSLLFLPGFLLLLLLAPWLVQIFYKVTSPEIVTFVRWLLLANSLLVADTLFRSWFKVTSNTGSLLIIGIVQVVFLSVFGGWLLNTFNLNGVALSMGLLQLISATISIFYWRKYAGSALSDQSKGRKASKH